MRVSSEEQKTKESVETQAGFLEDYCKLYGYDVAGVYKDEAISGTVPMQERPQGSRLLADAKEGALDSVLVYRLDRIGRLLLVVVDAHDRLGQAGVALKRANEPIDTSSPSGRLIFQMLASFAEFERATIVERSRDGLHRAFKNGKQLGRVPGREGRRGPRRRGPAAGRCHLLVWIAGAPRGGGKCARWTQLR